MAWRISSENDVRNLQVWDPEERSHTRVTPEEYEGAAQAAMAKAIDEQNNGGRGRS